MYRNWEKKEIIQTSYFYPPKTAILAILKKDIQRYASSEFKAQLLRISNSTKYNSPFCKSYQCNPIFFH